MVVFLAFRYVALALGVVALLTSLVKFLHFPFRELSQALKPPAAVVAHQCYVTLRCGYYILNVKSNMAVSIGL